MPTRGNLKDTPNPSKEHAESVSRCRRAMFFPIIAPMIEAAFRDRIAEALWPASATGMSLWAILDCARDERIYPALRTSQLDYLCLYSGRLHREVEAAAPHLIEIPPHSRFPRQLIEMGWGQSWGVFLRIKDPSNLRSHLRGFLRVQDESGKILIFRYYDPRVLRVYLPTCLPDELRTVFGPVSSYLVEDEGGQALIDFEFDGSRLHQHRIGLTGEGSA
jgi:hypothetical protein